MKKKADKRKEAKENKKIHKVLHKGVTYPLYHLS